MRGRRITARGLGQGTQRRDTLGEGRFQLSAFWVIRRQAIHRLVQLEHGHDRRVVVLERGRPIPEPARTSLVNWQRCGKTTSCLSSKSG